MHPSYRNYWLLPLLWLGCLLAGGCASSTAQGTQAQQGALDKLLLFQKTPCYGTCPAYNATFYSDGSILFEGFRYVPVLDSVRLQLTPEQLQKVQASLRNLNYTALESSYPSPYTDMPSTYLTFYEQGREVKRVKHQQEGPAQLQQTIGELHELVMRLLVGK
ncbi:DUF6438 domain-containing protein [Pontibacter flavimaris]|uniref:DUF6438 domain-containing protein n=1 Tax=Pontibacter flavimaris TaxID=1797110 RepID=A0A1Q5PHK5_9BACT|nr:DUF6438 domain-containing protein [Pontibacter flavimaris]OKL41714.1 hypothetical protein A3841_11855 [Pontibacter flavimaris]